MIVEIARITARQLLGRRRTVLLLLLAVIPILMAGIFRIAGASRPGDTEGFIDAVLVGLVVTLLMPLVALILGTTVFGAEIEDGTVVYLLAKPIPRRVVVLTKWLVAASIAATLSAAAALIAGVLGLAGTDSGIGISIGYAVAVAVGSTIYVAAFVALSLVTSRALVAGLLYILVWEGALASSFPGTRFLSIRQYTLAIADAAGVGGLVTSDVLAPATAVLLGAVVVVVALALAIRRLGVFEVPQGD
jgi:ABC-2 type transport system permease protein